jgi:hypothetical protein
MYHYSWHQSTNVSRQKYTCGFCSSIVSPDHGYQTANGVGHTARIYICPNCGCPTFFGADKKQVPAIRLGNEVKGITDEHVQSAYNEARDCSGCGAYSGSVLLCRKLLMNIAVNHGAKSGESFSYYIDYLEANGFVPPNGKAWVDVIRKKGNEATHEIPIMSSADAQQVLHFTEMLLRFIYEFPSMIPQETNVQ